MVLLPIGMAQGQVTLTSTDMFNAIGQYYRVHAGSANFDVTTLNLGAKGGPLTWDFTSGPTDIVYRYDYVGTNDGGVAADFPLATLVERQTNEGTGLVKGRLFLKQAPGKGRINYGFYTPDEIMSEGRFDPPLTDFPDPLTYQGKWNLTTSFPTTLDLGLAVEIVNNYTATAVVDAYGTVTLPGLGTVECLRVNELDQQDTMIDDGEGNLTNVETDYIRIYYFLSPGRGIVAEIHSQQSTAGAPPDNFATAAQFTRMFEFNRAVPIQGPSPVTDLELTRAGTSFVLNWSKPDNTVSFRVEYTSNPTSTNAWQLLTATSKLLAIDASPDLTQPRFYRVVSLGE